MTDFAIYDMDRTITRSATYTPFLLHCARRRSPWRMALTPAVLGSMAAYGVKAIDRARLKEINHQLLLGDGVPAADLTPLVESFADETVRSNVQRGALRAIARDRAEGRRLVMATASYALYVEAIARRLGFDDVIATRSVRGSDGRVMARIEGENCYGAAKKRMIEAWLDRQAIDRSAVHVRFYSDHVSDAPLFDWADEPVAVNPSGGLRKLARQRDWPTEDWSR